jgi:hypothetical protein
MTKYTINDLREGRVAVINDGTVEELRKVLKHAFSNDHFKPDGTYQFYIVDPDEDGVWDCADKVTTPTQSVKVFIEEIERPSSDPLTLENCEFVRCDSWVGSTFKVGGVYTKKLAQTKVEEILIGFRDNPDISTWINTFSPITEEEYVEELKRAEKVTCEDSAQAGETRSADPLATLDDFCISIEGYNQVTKFEVKYILDKKASFNSGDLIEVVTVAVNNYLRGKQQ